MTPTYGVDVVDISQGTLSVWYCTRCVLAHARSPARTHTHTQTHTPPVCYPPAVVAVSGMSPGPACVISWRLKDNNWS